MSGQPEREEPQNLVAQYRKVFVVVPAEAVTGGPEAQHQLVDAIRRNGGEAYVSYYPFDVPAEVPEEYRHYDVLQRTPEDARGNLIVFPEIAPFMARKVSRAATGIWWLSVDNFLQIKSPPPWHELRRHVHFAQSHYAADFLALNDVQPVPLTDYLNDDFLETLWKPWRRSAIAYNAKSALVVERLKRASPELAKLTWIELAHMSREHVRGLLSDVKIYADFGPHPGRDRMPREAALCGACVLTNRRGSANFAEDVPLPSMYKLDHWDPDFAENVVRMIRLIFAMRPLHVWRLRGYRHFAASGKAMFIDEVRRAFFE